MRNVRIKHVVLEQYSPVVRSKVQRLNYKLRVEIGGVSVRVDSWLVGRSHLSLPKLKQMVKKIVSLFIADNSFPKYT